MESTLKETPLTAIHRELAARIVDFAGWAMPVMYGGILQEARAVRSDTGIFDISHMGRIRVHGPGATLLLQKITSNDVTALRSTEAQYSLLTNPEGGIIDDIIVYREDENSYLVVINASNSSKDIEWMLSHENNGVVIDDLTEKTAMIAVQGPAAPPMVSHLAHRSELLELRRFQYAIGEIAGAEATFCRTGYTGEDGFELIVPASRAADVWTALMGAGATPCGLGARDALRIEAGYPLYGHEIDDATSPVEAGLMWVVKLDKGAFIGSEPIRRIKQQGPSRRLMGLVSADRLQPRQGYTIYLGSDMIGTITSGVFSPTCGHSLAMGYIDAEHARVGVQVSIAVRDKRIAATTVQKKSLMSHRPD